ncbi:SigE family RNA polymerase sigma factor [Nocardioides plantarum]|uniref:SigE family RNA polymerase sigma factor n=1 Tax=Nocardioides plantarum TaxID=29299 RepID=A0ABV5K3Z5_9ACTN|nr:SigE family RNA polymerase sigma factor [Nocardioides plantarum]
MAGSAGPTGFEEYAVARGPWLQRVAFLLSGDAHLAQDLAQSTLVQAHRSWKRVQAADDPNAYVRRILVNELRTLQRRRSWSEVVSDEPATLRLAPAGDDVEVGVVQRLEVERLLGRLSPRARAVLTLRYLEDLPATEVADLLGLSPSSVRSATSRALTRLAEITSTEAHDDDR